MGSINLEFLENISPQTTKDDLSPRRTYRDAYTYKDLHFDIKLGTLVGNAPENKRKNTTDLEDLRDIGAVKQAVANILNTKQGEKLLNPYLGMDLSDYVFEPITEQTADLLARTILKGLAEQEPRVTVTNIQVMGDMENNQYLITFVLQFPNLNTNKVTFNGTLTTEGFTI
jgi:phage baseplate assembly protein W